MKIHLLLAVAFVLLPLSGQKARATQADDTTIMITAQNPGLTPFIEQLTLVASDASAIKSIKFAVASKPDSVVRPLTATYSNEYLAERGYLITETGEIFLPVYGLYDNYANTVTLTYLFTDGSSKQDSTTITTAAFDDPCGYSAPTVLQPRTASTSLGYDYVLLKGRCSDNSPAIIDTDGILRWVGTAGLSSYNLAFFDNSIYIADEALLYRNDLDGTVGLLGDFSSMGVAQFHHNVDRGKVGLLFEADTDAYFESVIMEIDAAGTLLQTWNMADIISEAMVAGGDDPDLFVFPSPSDWFHNNAVTYNRADDSLIVSSREDFLICIDYTTGAIKWILGDPEKQWYQFPSLQKFALTLTPGSLPPIGQHAVSVTYDQNVLVFDNGTASLFFTDLPGASRSYASPRKYQIDAQAMTATEVWNYPMNESVFSPFCGSVYEDKPLNYLVDYAFVSVPPDTNRSARLLGLDAAGAKVFDYQYATTGCDAIFNAVPLHLEDAAFPVIEPRARNLSTRGSVGSAENSLIGGFIITGAESETVLLRALGPSLHDSGLNDVVGDPVLMLYDSSGTLIAMNDDWGSDPNAAEISTNGLAPSDPAEAATIQTLAPGGYTFVVTGKDASEGIGLVEAYDLSPLASARLGNISTRGAVGPGDQNLISGFIIGDVASNTLVLRAIGPSLSSAGISNPLSDPMLTVYDSNGVAIAGNDNWQDDVSATNIEQLGLAPGDAAEAATILHLPAGAYTTIVVGPDGETGVGLVEMFDL